MKVYKINVKTAELAKLKAESPNLAEFWLYWNTEMPSIIFFTYAFPQTIKSQRKKNKLTSCP